MKHEFLYKEYEQCFIQLRYYDDRQLSLLRNLFALTIVAVGAQFAVYKTAGISGETFYLCASLLGTVLLAAAVLAHIALVQNRLYFVFVARQINAIRKFLLTEESTNFRENQLYTATNFPAAKIFSLHSYTLFCSSLLAAMFAASLAYGLSNLIYGKTSAVIVDLAFFLSLGALLLGGFFYLRHSGAKPADVHIMNS